MTASSHTSTPLSTTLTFSGNVDQLLAQVEDRPQDFYQTISWALPSSTRLDGVYLTGVSLIRNVLNCPISTSISLLQNDQESLKPLEKSEDNLVLYRLPLSVPKGLNLQFLQDVEVIEAKTTQTE